MGTPINQISYLDKSRASTGPLILRIHQSSPPQDGKELSQAAVDICDRKHSVGRLRVSAGGPRQRRKRAGEEEKR